MRRVLLCFALLVSVLIPAGPSRAEDLSRCGAVELEDRPRLGQSGGWDASAHQRRHNQYQRRHPEVFASGYLSGKHFYVGFTHDVCRKLRRFRRGLSEEQWRVRAFHANWTYRELRQAQRCVNEYFSRDWLKMSATGVDVWRNKLEVMFEKNTAKRRRFIRRRCGTVDIRFTEGRVEPE